LQTSVLAQQVPYSTFYYVLSSVSCLQLTFI